VPVMVSGLKSEENKYPTVVTLTINYYQVDANRKRVLSAEMECQNYKTRTNDIFSYKLIFSFQPMTHSEIAKEFAFPWTVYLICYIGIYIFGLFMVGVFWIYKRIFTRNKKYKFVFMQYVRIQLIPVFYGFLLALFPNGVFLLSSSILMRGALW
jgi:hypothetical protein